MGDSKIKILDGKWLSKQVHRSVRAEVDKHQDSVGRPPGLGVIIVGENPASKAYVASKERVATKRCGFKTFNTSLPETASMEEVRNAIHSFNEDSAVDGILLQLPLPKGLDSNELLNGISPRKDADGLTPVSQGLLLRGEGKLRPCTPMGVMHLIDLAYSAIDAGQEGDVEISKADLSGKNALVLGRSILVGKPVASLLLERNATVISAHSRTKDVESLSQQADIVVAAVGVPHLVNSKWIKNGAVVIDVGINRLEDGTLTGDVDYESCKENAFAITPVPGGVGPMTVAMLMQNTLFAYKAMHSLS